MATFFFFFFKICHYCHFYWKLSQTQWIFWNFFAKHWEKKIFRLLSQFKYLAKYIYNVCLIFFLSLIAKFGYNQLMDDCPQLHHKIGQKNTVLQCILLPVKKRCLSLSILNIPKYFCTDSRRVQQGTGVFMVCMASTMFLGANKLILYKQRRSTWIPPCIFVCVCVANLFK